MKSKLKKAVGAAAVNPLEVNSEDSVVCSFRFAGDFPGFDGHFPGYPVLPAVVQVLVAQVVVEQRLDRALILKRLERAKFLKQVRPEQLLRVNCRERQSGSQQIWDASLEADGEAAAVFRMTLVEESEG